MRVLRISSRWVGWVAMVAMLLATLVPALGHALAAGTGARGAWVEVCTAQGSRWAQLGDEGQQIPSPMEQAPEHCAYCSLHAPDLGLPPAAFGVLLWAETGRGPLMAVEAEREPLRLWSAAQPRAPPFFS